MYESEIGVLREKDNRAKWYTNKGSFIVEKSQLNSEISAKTANDSSTKLGKNNNKPNNKMLKSNQQDIECFN